MAYIELEPFIELRLLSTERIEAYIQLVLAWIFV